MWSLRAATFVTVAVVAASVLVAPVSAGGAEVILQPGTSGCTGVLPSNDGNTDMRLVGGTMYPGGTAIFEISYPVNAGNVGKEFTILDCAYINDVAALKYIGLVRPQQPVLRAQLDAGRAHRRPGRRPVLQLRQDDGQPHRLAGEPAQGRSGVLHHSPAARRDVQDSRRSDLAIRNATAHVGRDDAATGSSRSCFRTPRCPRTRNPRIG